MPTQLIDAIARGDYNETEKIGYIEVVFQRGYQSTVENAEKVAKNFFTENFSNHASELDMNLIELTLKFGTAGYSTFHYVIHPKGVNVSEETIANTLPAVA